MAHPFDYFQSVSDVVRRGIFRRLTEGKRSFVKDQLRALQSLQKLRRELSPDEAKLRESMDVGVNTVLKDKPIKLFGKCCELSGWADRSLPSDVADGFPVVGSLCKTGVYEGRTLPALLSPEELRSQAAWVRHDAVGSCRSSGDDEVDAELWESVLKDLRNGWAAGPFYSEEQVSNELGGDGDWVASRRFPIIQGKNRKVRGVDDLSRSLVNSTVECFEKINLIVPGSADHVSSLIAYMSMVASSENVQVRLSDGSVLEAPRHLDFASPESRVVHGTTIDLSAAYRQLAVRAAHRWACVLVAYDPVKKCPAYVVMKALPFGSMAAVEAFLRTSLALRHCGEVMAHIAWCVFFDDFPLVDYAILAETSKSTALTFLKILVWTVSIEKVAPVSSEITALGVTFHCSAVVNGELCEAIASCP
eukprot:3107453-Amphidinium_carterae.1